MSAEIENVKSQVRKLLTEFLQEHPQKKESVFVIGCSSSEIAGGKMGKDSSEEIGKAVFETAHEILRSNGIYLACQCCEHLNRALVIEQDCADRYGYEPVSVVPWLHGGGSFATAAFYGFENAVVVEHVKASAGVDIGDVLIGMHLKDVAVPVHPAQNVVGNAHVVAAWCRPKLIGGERARYQTE
ncbi:TIGR01440 family protein [Treponema sp.]|uniref:TIGR01440 family protein n=1 Tax=Treponema sp. TaxID=166 RepID=UPI00298E1A32|nr:TIGR01440 family protein [Treponema sp.]MCQ2241652.1 TIGR01440 family protein [Treponema sp.]